MRLSCLAILILVASLKGFSQSKEQTREITQFIDDWHLAASQANATRYFSAIADNGVFIGTDSSERWSKDEFFAFAKPHFDKGKAWDFKAFNRDIHISPEGKYVWFSELLNTWMGVCRGSGILRKNGNSWLIEQYHLSVTVPNEVIKDFITLVDNFGKAKK